MKLIRKICFVILFNINNLINESRFKNTCRNVFLKFKHNIPREFMINLGDNIVQVGTPQTETLERICRCIGKKGNAIIIEPDKKNISRLKSKLVEIGNPNVTLVEKAAWNETGEREMLFSKKWAGNHRLVNKKITIDNDEIEIQETGGFEKRIVQIDTVENIVKANGMKHIDYIEIAVNGAEYEVLEGVNKMIPFTKRLFVKGHAREVDSGQPIYHKIQQYLLDKSYIVNITKTSKSPSSEWGLREGDVYAWRD